MNKEQTAIAKTIEQWTKLAETGEDKPELEGVVANCHLCQYNKEMKSGRVCRACKYCPYFKKYGVCDKVGMPYDLWREAKNKADKRIHAAAFLAQVETLQEKPMIEIDGVEISTETTRAALKAYGVTLKKPEPEKPKLRHGDYGLSVNKGMRIHLWSFIKGFDWNDPMALTGERQDYSEIGVRTDDDSTTVLGNIFADLQALGAEPLEEFEKKGCGGGIFKARICNGGFELEVHTPRTNSGYGLVTVNDDQLHEIILKLRRMETTMKAKQDAAKIK